MFYETLFIVRPNADEDALQGAIAATREHITAAGGEILLESTWGKRKLAYEVGPFAEGIYVQINFTADPSYPPRLERAFRLHDDVIRFLIVRTDGPPPPPEKVPNYLEADAEPEQAEYDSEAEPEPAGAES